MSLDIRYLAESPSCSCLIQVKQMSTRNAVYLYEKTELGHFVKDILLFSMQEESQTGFGMTCE